MTLEFDNFSSIRLKIANFQISSQDFGSSYIKIAWIHEFSHFSSRCWSKFHKNDKLNQKWIRIFVYKFIKTEKKSVAYIQILQWLYTMMKNDRYLTMNFVDYSFSVFGLFAVIVSWLMASLYLATSVALGDLCVSPDGYLTRAVPSTLASEVLSYYTHCESARSNPFTQRLRDGQRAVANMRTNLNDVTRIADGLFKNQQPRLSSLMTDVNSVDRLMSTLTTLLDCRPLHIQYVHAAKSLCHLGLWVYIQDYFLFLNMNESKYPSFYHYSDTDSPSCCSPASQLVYSSLFSSGSTLTHGFTFENGEESIYRSTGV